MGKALDAPRRIGGSWDRPGANAWIGRDCEPGKPDQRSSSEAAEHQKSVFGQRRRRRWSRPGPSAGPAPRPRSIIRPGRLPPRYCRGLAARPLGGRWSWSISASSVLLQSAPLRHDDDEQVSPKKSAYPREGGDVDSRSPRTSGHRRCRAGGRPRSRARPGRRPAAQLILGAEAGGDLEQQAHAVLAQRLLRHKHCCFGLLHGQARLGTPSIASGGAGPTAAGIPPAPVSSGRSGRAWSWPGRGRPRSARAGRAAGRAQAPGSGTFRSGWRSSPRPAKARGPPSRGRAISR